MLYSGEVIKWVIKIKKFTNSCTFIIKNGTSKLAKRVCYGYSQDENGELKYAFTLNNTAVASPRILIPILENT